MKSFRLFNALVLSMLSVFAIGCSDQGGAPDLSQWFKGAEAPKMVHLDRELYVGMIKNAAGEVDRLCLTDGSDVILSVEIYGNGRAIKIASSGIPSLLVHQGSSGIDVTRYLRLPDGAIKQVVYGADGRVAEERFFAEKRVFSSAGLRGWGE